MQKSTKKSPRDTIENLIKIKRKQLEYYLANNKLPEGYEVEMSDYEIKTLKNGKIHGISDNGVFYPAIINNDGVFYFSYSRLGRLSGPAAISITKGIKYYLQNVEIDKDAFDIYVKYPDNRSFEIDIRECGLNIIKKSDMIELMINSGKKYLPNEIDYLRDAKYYSRYNTHILKRYGVPDEHIKGLFEIIGYKISEIPLPEDFIIENIDKLDKKKVLINSDISKDLALKLLDGYNPEFIERFLQMKYGNN